MTGKSTTDIRVYVPRNEIPEVPPILYRGQSFTTHSTLSRNQSAMSGLTLRQALLLLTLVALIAVLGVFRISALLIGAIAIVTVFYFIDLLFNLFLVSRSLSRTTEITVTSDQLDVARKIYPKYTILCPLYKEENILPQFVVAMENLDYPAKSLQILLLLEENDPETINAARAMNLPQHFEIVVVPHTMPKTKPKACNYGLRRAKGDFVVIYDAEDVPEPLQLKKAVIAFDQVSPQIGCIQAKLNFYNPRQNLITRIFTAEYSLWFDLILVGLQSINAPIPLGGTSNHFRTEVLRELRGWDAFNVTEDADLGMRLVKHGYTTAILDSVTFEEANSQSVNWFWQRTRWIKGYIQTYIVHTRDRRGFKDSPRSHSIIFQTVIGGKVISLFVNPLMWLLTILYFAMNATLGPAISSLFPRSILYLAVISLILGNFLYMYYYMIGCAKRGDYDLIKYAIFVPIYWLGMSIAAYRAFYEVIVMPHHWSKTKHGLHLKKLIPDAEPTNVI